MRFLLVAFEGESNLIGQVAKKLLALGHEVHVFNVDHATLTHMSDRDELPRYYRSCGLSEDQTTDLDSVFTETNKLPLDTTADQVDYEFIERFERDYLSRPLAFHVARDPVLWTSTHHRDIYYHPPNKHILYKQFELGLRLVDDLFQQFRPDVVFTMNNQYFYKTLLFDTAFRRGIAFYCLAELRIDNLAMLVENYRFGLSGVLAAEMDRLESSNEDSFDDADAFSERLRGSTGHTAPYAQHQIILAASQDRLKARVSVLRELKYLWSVFRYRIRARFTTWKKYRGRFKRDYFLPAWRDVLRIEWRSFRRVREYWRNSRFTNDVLPSEKFVYVTLHVIPESSVLTFGETADELQCVTQLAKSLPVDWRIVVKANPQMLTSINSHPTSFYERLASIPSVTIIDPRLPSNDILKKCSAVASICGTSLLEGLIHGKPAICWGDPDFYPLNRLCKFREIRDMRAFLEEPMDDNVRTYLQSCYNKALRIDIPYLIGDCGANIDTETYRSQVEQIVNQLLSVTDDDRLLKDARQSAHPGSEQALHAAKPHARD